MSFESADAIVRELYPDAQSLAESVGVTIPGYDTAGENWLRRVRDRFAGDAAEILAADYPEDAASDLGYSMMHGSTSLTWEIFADLQLWQFDADLLYSDCADVETAHSIRRIHGCTVLSGPEDLAKVAGTLLDEISSNLTSQMLWALKHVIDSATDE
jgi:hypothetical protein